MLEFARSLPGMRKAIDGELARDGMDRERVLACAVRLLDRGFFRVGGESYAAENETYGLATMHKKHVALEEDNVIAFDYRAKSGKRRVQSLVDPEIYDIVAALKRRRGGLPELLAYKRGRRWVDVRSADINDFVKEVTGGDFTAKDFRTWNATLLAAVALSVSGPAHASVTQRKRAMARAVKEVSGYLGNTPAVARASYIDPRIFDRYETGQIISGALEDIGGEGGLGALHGPPEEAVLDLLTEERSEAVEKVTEAFKGTPVAV